MRNVAEVILDFNYLKMISFVRICDKNYNCNKHPCEIPCEDCVFNIYSNTEINWVCDTWAANDINSIRFMDNEFLYRFFDND